MRLKIDQSPGTGYGGVVERGLIQPDAEEAPDGERFGGSPSNSRSEYPARVSPLLPERFRYSPMTFVQMAKFQLAGHLDTIARGGGGIAPKVVLFRELCPMIPRRSVDHCRGRLKTPRA
jgi:hypothetical protein